jgi:hypothetical protein
VLIAGSTSGVLSGQTVNKTNADDTYDVLVASFTSGGVLQWSRLYGTASADSDGRSIAVDSSSGAAFVAGWTRGSINGQSSLGEDDIFVLKLQ